MNEINKTKYPICKTCKTGDYLTVSGGSYYCRQCTNDEVSFKTLKVAQATNRKELSTRAHFLAAALLDEPDRLLRGRIIIKLMKTIKEME